MNRPPPGTGVSSAHPPIDYPRVAQRTRGYSLIEAILASFLLLFTFFLVSSLFNTGLQYSRKVEQRMAAVQFAEKRMAEVRLWAKGTDDWSGPPNSPTDPQFTDFTVTTQLVTEALYSPCTRLEEAYPPDDMRAMPTMAKKVVLTVSKPGIPDFTMAGVVTKGDAPWPATADIRLSPSTPTTLGPSDELLLTATAYDSAGNEVKDLFFHWEVEPDFTGGNPTTAEIRLKTRDGRQAIVRNRIRRRAGTWLPTNGDCLVVAFARYKGQYRRGNDNVKIKMVNP